MLTEMVVELLRVFYRLRQHWDEFLIIFLFVSRADDSHRTHFLNGGSSPGQCSLWSTVKCERRALLLCSQTISAASGGRANSPRGFTDLYIIKVPACAFYLCVFRYKEK